MHGIEELVYALCSQLKKALEKTYQYEYDMNERVECSIIHFTLNACHCMDLYMGIPCLQTWKSGFVIHPEKG